MLPALVACPALTALVDFNVSHVHRLGTLDRGQGCYPRPFSQMFPALVYLPTLRLLVALFRVESPDNQTALQVGFGMVSSPHATFRNVPHRFGRGAKHGRAWVFLYVPQNLSFSLV
jgi:hypothetical protein